MSKTKANFVVDDSFPLIDGIGHSDKLDFVRVKGGGSTNTTYFDRGADILNTHHVICSTGPVAVKSGQVASYVECLVQPNFYSSGGGTVGGALNYITPGDSHFQRGSDRVLLHRIVVNGSLCRPHGESLDRFEVLPPAPKVFVALVCDTQATDYAPGDPLVVGSAFDSAFFLSYVSGVPVLDADNAYRFRVLAHDVIDFADCPETPYGWVDMPSVWNSAGVPPDVVTTVAEHYGYSFWRAVSRGFIFDVDLNDALCTFRSSAPDSSCFGDIAFGIVAVLFDGVNIRPFVPAANAFNYVDIQFSSFCYFSDWLTPSIPHAPAGADGSVVPPAEDDLDVLADESARLAGDAANLPGAMRPVHKKVRKGDAGFYNFMSRNDDALMEFPDDPEVALLPVPGTRGAMKGPSRKKVRRRGAYSGPPARHEGSFEYFEGDDWNDFTRKTW